jgi:hypothetical protein
LVRNVFVLFKRLAALEVLFADLWRYLLERLRV